MRAGPEPVDECVVAGALRAEGLVRRRFQALLDDRRPEPVHLSEMPDEIGDVPTRAMLHSRLEVAFSRGREALAVLRDRGQVIEVEHRHGMTVLQSGTRSVLIIPRSCFAALCAYGMNRPLLSASSGQSGNGPLRRREKRPRMQRRQASRCARVVFEWRSR